MTERLCDLGERRIIDELLRPRYAAATQFGDDCAQLAPLGAGERLVVTTDPCPPPMAHLLGFADEYYRGWLLATINLSDIAAAGARPAGVLTSLQLPSTTPVAEFLRLLDGIDDCCDLHETEVLGGNLKEASQIDATATAFGVVDGRPLGRAGAQDGDLVVAIGPFGSFWAGVLMMRCGLWRRDSADPRIAGVIKPRPQLAAGWAVRQGRLLQACTDASDGLYPALVQLAEPAGVGIVVEAEEITYADEVLDAAEALEMHPLRLALGWGDWQLVGTCQPADLRPLEQAVARAGARLTRVGRVESRPGVRLKLEGTEGRLLPLDSQRFTQESWFSSGVDGYAGWLVDAALIEPE